MVETVGEFVKKILKWVFYLSLLLVALGLYAWKVEPYLIKVKHYDIKVENSTKKIRLVQIADTEISEAYGVSQLDKIIEKVNALEPDIVVFTGDLYANHWKFGPDEALMASMQKLNVQIKKYAVWGNNDYGGGAVRIYENQMSELGFTLLRNEGVYLKIDDSLSLFIAGIDDPQMGNPDMMALMKTKTEKASLNILLSHNPEMVSELKAGDFDLVLSGHTHGGQVNLPFMKDLLHGQIPYLKGEFSLDELDGTRLFVSNGLGMSRLSIRLFTPPQLLVFDIGR